MHGVGLLISSACKSINYRNSQLVRIKVIGPDIERLTTVTLKGVWRDHVCVGTMCVCVKGPCVCRNHVCVCEGTMCECVEGPCVSVWRDHV